MNRYLAGQGVHLSHLAPYRQSLEEVFIDLTRALFAPEFSWRTGRQNVIDGLGKGRLAALNLLLLGCAGLMLPALIRSSGPGLGVLFLYLIVEEAIVGLMVRGGETLRGFTEYLPYNLVQDLGDDLAHYPEVLARINSDRAERDLAPLEFLDVDVMAIAVLAYSAIFLLIAFLSMRRRDL